MADTTSKTPSNERKTKEVFRVPKVGRFPNFTLSDYWSGVYLLDRSKRLRNTGRGLGEKPSQKTR